MLIEQAFFSVPEILTANFYPTTEYEGGLVTAMSRAILQELNGRNTPNPNALIQGECSFTPGGIPIGGAKRRFLRADMFVNLKPLDLGNREFERFGWRYHNWLEAKFFRRGRKVDGGFKKIVNQTSHTALIAADLIRLATLVPETRGIPSRSARYLLHVYDCKPSDHVFYNRDDQTERTWLKHLHSGASSRKIKGLHGANEGKVFKGIVGTRDLKLSLRVTNRVIRPVVIDDAKANYWCILTRINSIKARVGENSFTVAANRQVTASSDGAIEEIRQYVASTIGMKSDQAAKEPDPPGVSGPGAVDLPPAPAVAPGLLALPGGVDEVLVDPEEFPDFAAPP